MIIELNDNTCPDNIVYLRKKYAVSRRGLARLSGIREDTLRRIENHVDPPIFEYTVLRRICTIFQVPLEDLIGKDLSAKI